MASARSVEGTNIPFSTVLTVLRETPRRAASSVCVSPRSVRISFSLFVSIRSIVTAGPPFQKDINNQRYGNAGT